MKFSPKQLADFAEYARRYKCKFIEFHPENQSVLFWRDEMNLHLEEYF